METRRCKGSSKVTGKGEKKQNGHQIWPGSSTRSLGSNFALMDVRTGTKSKVGVAKRETSRG